MSIAHLDISYPSLKFFQEDCEVCSCDAQKLLDTGTYSLMYYGFVVSKYHPNFRQEDCAPMDVRPSAWQSRLNTWNNSLNPKHAWPAFADEAAQYIGEFLPPYGPQATAPAEHEFAVSDALGMYMMGEEL